MADNKENGDGSRIRKLNPLWGIKYDLYRNIINPVGVQSLQRLSLTRIAITEWQRALYSLKHCEWSTVMWDTASKLVLKNILNLSRMELILKPEEIVKSVGEEINKFLNFFIVDKASTKIYIKHLQWNKQGTIDRIKTVSMVIDDDDISNMEKYTLACNCCLEEKIRLLLTKFDENFLDNFMGKTNILIQFWTSYIKDDYESLLKVCNIKKYKNKDEKKDIYYKILLLLIESRNEVAVQYIWENFIDKETKVKVLFLAHFIKFETSSQIFQYFLSQAHHLIHPCLLEALPSLLNDIANDWRLQDRVKPTAEFVLQFVRQIYYPDKVFKVLEFEDVLLVIILCWQRNVIDDSETIALINKITSQYEICFIEVDQKDLYVHFEKMCVHFAISGMFDIVYPFIKRFLSNNLIKHFFKEQSIEICFILFKNKFDKFKEFFIILRENLCFKELPLLEQEKATRRLQEITLNADKLERVDEFLIWRNVGIIDNNANLKVGIVDKNNK